jgi:hypothetical protein
MKKVSLEFVSVLSTGLGLFLLSAIQVSAQPLVMNTPANISINPEEPLPANGTVSISTEGATDSDMNVIPPEGVSVIISSDTITVTNQPVDIATADEDEGDGNGNGNGGGDTDDGDNEEVPPPEITPGEGSQLPLPGFGSGEGSGSNIGSNGASNGGGGGSDSADGADG